jgi:Flp pilus assembly protein TadG
MRNLMHLRRPDHQRGAISIEFALTILVIMFVTFWVIEFCMLFYTYTVISDAAKEGVRYAIVNASDYVSGDCVTTNNTAQKVHQYVGLTFHQTSSVNICVSYPDGDPNTTPLARVLINVTYSYIPYFKLPGWNPTVTASAAGRVIH